MFVDLNCECTNCVCVWMKLPSVECLFGCSVKIVIIKVSFEIMPASLWWSQATNTVLKRRISTCYQAATVWGALLPWIGGDVAHLASAICFPSGLSSAASCQPSHSSYMCLKIRVTHFTRISSRAQVRKWSSAHHMRQNHDKTLALKRGGGGPWALP
jgi:hypothetical protein